MIINILYIEYEEGRRKDTLSKTTETTETETPINIKRLKPMPCREMVNHLYQYQLYQLKKDTPISETLLYNTYN